MNDPLQARAYELSEELSGSAVRLLFHVAGFSSCPRGACLAKGKTLAERMKCSERTIRRRFAELVDAGLVVKTRRRMRYSIRTLTDLGRAFVSFLREGGSRSMSGHVSGHKGEAQPPRTNSPRSSLQTNEAKPRKRSSQPSERFDPTRYVLPLRRARLLERTWNSVASWLSTARTVTAARCKLAHRAFVTLSDVLRTSKGFGAFVRVQADRGRSVGSEDLVRLAVDDAHKRGRDFGTIETAIAYVTKVALACIAERRLPGERMPKGSVVAPGDRRDAILQAFGGAS